MLLEILGMAMINPTLESMENLDKIAYVNKNVKSIEVVKENYSDELLFPHKGNSYNKFLTENESEIKNVVSDLKSRKDKDEQYLKWIDIPQVQLNGHLAEIYAQALTLKSRKNGNVSRPLVVLGIEGAKFSSDFLLNMTGYNDGDVYYYSDIDPLSFNNFIKNTKVGIQNLNFLVVSQTGKNFETEDAFKRFEQELIDYYQAQGQRPKDARISAQKHFAICTNKFAKEENLKERVRNNPYYLQNLYTHDGIPQRFSMFDDAGLFVLAYAGVPQSYTTRILQSAQKVSNKYLDENNIDNNPAIKNALFNVYSRNNGHKILFQQYFGRFFENAGENWAKQLYFESMKDFDFISSKAPDSFYYLSETIFNHKNHKDYYVVMTTVDSNVSKNYNHYITAVKDSYADAKPIIVETLAVEGDSIKPESIGEYVQSKFFETVYTGCLRRALSKKHKNDVYLQYPEVMNVYKGRYLKKTSLTIDDVRKAKDVDRTNVKKDYEKYGVSVGAKN